MGVEMSVDVFAALSQLYKSPFNRAAIRAVLAIANATPYTGVSLVNGVG